MSEFGIAVKAAIVRDDRLLLLYKSDVGVEGDIDTTRRHDLPGGRLQLGESPFDGLLREVVEETNLEVQILSPLDVWHQFDPARQFQLVGITFACRYISGEVVLSEEHSSHEWLTRADVDQKNWPDGDTLLSALDSVTHGESRRKP